jgi:hypothetical protein
MIKNQITILVIILFTTIASCAAKKAKVTVILPKGQSAIVKCINNQEVQSCNFKDSSKHTFILDVDRLKYINISSKMLLVDLMVKPGDNLTLFYNPKHWVWKIEGCTESEKQLYKHSFSSPSNKYDFDKSFYSQYEEFTKDFYKYESDYIDSLDISLEQKSLVKEKLRFDYFASAQRCLTRGSYTAELRNGLCYKEAVEFFAKEIDFSEGIVDCTGFMTYAHMVMAANYKPQALFPQDQYWLMMKDIVNHSNTLLAKAALLSAYDVTYTNIGHTCFEDHYPEVIRLLGQTTIDNLTLDQSWNKIKRGSVAADFDFKLTDGQMKKISDYRGKWVCLMVDLASMYNAIPMYQSLCEIAHDFKDDMEFIIISMDNEQEWKTQINNHFSNYENVILGNRYHYTKHNENVWESLVDSKFYNLKTWPASVLIDPEGKIYFSRGFHPCLVKSYPEILKTIVNTKN